MLDCPLSDRDGRSAEGKLIAESGQSADGFRIRLTSRTIVFLRVLRSAAKQGELRGTGSVIAADLDMAAKICRLVWLRLFHVRNRPSGETIKNARVPKGMRINLSQRLRPGKPVLRYPSKPSRPKVKDPLALVALQTAANSLTD